MEEKNLSRKGERGNVLFLILIAVALFAALSYAVTQSTRSGGGSTERETSILSGASMTQHPTAMRTAIIRMILGGVDVADLEFNAPRSFGNLTSEAQGVFHPNGGGAVYQDAPVDLMDATTQGTWFYNANFEIPDIGKSAAGGNDIIAFLPNIKQAICLQINDEFGINTTDCTNNAAGVPQVDNAVVPDIRVDADDGYSYPPAAPRILQGGNSGGTCAAFSGQPSGCFFDNVNAQYVFYSVLLER